MDVLMVMCNMEKTLTRLQDQEIKQAPNVVKDFKVTSWLLLKLHTWTIVFDVHA
jgi:hypothetical protein